MHAGGGEQTEQRNKARGSETLETEGILSVLHDASHTDACDASPYCRY